MKKYYKKNGQAVNAIKFYGVGTESSRTLAQTFGQQTVMHADQNTVGVVTPDGVKTANQGDYIVEDGGKLSVASESEFAANYSATAPVAATEPVAPIQP